MWKTVYIEYITFLCKIVFAFSSCFFTCYIDFATQNNIFSSSLLFWICIWLFIDSRFNNLIFIASLYKYVVISLVFVTTLIPLIWLKITALQSFKLESSNLNTSSYISGISGELWTSNFTPPCSLLFVYHFQFLLRIICSYLLNWQDIIYRIIAPHIFIKISFKYTRNGLFKLNFRDCTKLYFT